MSKSKQKRIEKLESIVVGAGFLLRKLESEFSPLLGVGMSEQVAHCIRDCRQVEASVMQRKEAQMEKDNGGYAGS
jgi:hypothetical protein